MPKIVEYTNKDDKLTPLGEGETAWTGAGRRIAPAYNEAATLIRESERGIVQGGEDIASATGLGVKGAENVAASLGHQVRAGENVARAAGDVAKNAETVERAAGEQTAAGKAQGQAEVLKADQIEKLEKAFLSQYKDLFDIGEGGATKAARGGGGGFNTRGGGGSSDPFGIMSNRFPQDYGGGNEILNGATALTRKLSDKELEAYRAKQFPGVTTTATAYGYDPTTGTVSRSETKTNPDGTQDFSGSKGPVEDFSSNQSGETESQPYIAGGWMGRGGQSASAADAGPAAAPSASNIDWSSQIRTTMDNDAYAGSELSGGL